jgi:hypothetical protein
VPSETNAKQNAIIWSSCSFIIVLLCGIIGWLINGKDTALTNSINSLIAEQKTFVQKAEASDKTIMEALQKLCDRVGNAEGRISNLEIFIQMPYGQRQKLFESFKYSSPTGNSKHDK